MVRAEKSISATSAWLAFQKASAEMSRPGLTLDTGALMALENRRHSMTRVYVTALRHNVPITVPTVVIAEWSRAGAGKRFRERLLASLIVENLTKRIAEIAGEAIGQVRALPPNKGTIDAIVITSAWLRGDTIYSSDVRDLTTICSSVGAFAHVPIQHA
jgi:predicted nucleic acid-binding protein